MSAARILGCALGVSLAHAAFAAEPPADHRNFVSCPIVRDTPTVPCWLAEYEGETYFLTIQSDVTAPVIFVAVYAPVGTVTVAPPSVTVGAFEVPKLAWTLAAVPASSDISQRCPRPRVGPATSSTSPRCKC